MEEIKLQIAKEDGFDSWDMMIQCYCTTKAGQRVLKKNTDKALNMYIVGCSKNTGINKYKLSVISDALRLVKNYRNELKLPETCLDRQVKLAKEFVDDAIS